MTKISQKFYEKIETRKRCKGVHCVDLGESFPTSIYLQHFASIQPRTSLLKFEGGGFSAPVMGAVACRLRCRSTDREGPDVQAVSFARRGPSSGMKRVIRTVHQKYRPSTDTSSRCIGLWPSSLLRQWRLGLPASTSDFLTSPSRPESCFMRSKIMKEVQ